MFMSIINFEVDSAVMITASHLPMEMNGLKFFTRQGGFSGNDIKEILSYAEKNEYQLKSETQKAEKSLTLLHLQDIQMQVNQQF